MESASTQKQDIVKKLCTYIKIKVFNIIEDTMNKQELFYWNKKNFNLNKFIWNV